jgi:CHAT domain-containing protein
VIGNPSTQGFLDGFPGTTELPNTEPPDLPGAEAEAELVAGLLKKAGYRTRVVMGSDTPAGEVLAKLLARPWRILHIAARGAVDALHRDGDRRGGVVLSDGVLITAMESVALPLAPELVFLDISRLGKVIAGRSVSAPLATGLPRALVALGVPCIVVTGWAVPDHGAMTFARVLYERLVQQRQPFAAAVFAARRAAWQSDPQDTAWGAFQAYGDPDWTFEA